MTLLSVISDCIETSQVALCQFWDIISCVSIILRSVVTAIEYTGVKDGHVAENGAFATTCRHILFVGYQVSDITSELSQAMDELQIRNKVAALNNLVYEIGIDTGGEIRYDSIIRHWIDRYSVDIVHPTKTVDGDLVHLRSLLDGLPDLDQVPGTTKRNIGTGSVVT
jgi:hypothetical protein